MRITVLFFDAAATRKTTIEVADGAVVDDILSRLRESNSRLANLTLRSALNETHSNGTEPLNDGDEVAIFTPVSGG
jgi:molybdopterin converting factor small subunit